MLEAVARNAGALFFASDRDKDDPDVVLAAVNSGEILSL